MNHEKGKNLHFKAWESAWLIPAPWLNKICSLSPKECVWWGYGIYREVSGGGSETVRFYRQGCLWLRITKNTFPGRKRVRKYPTSLQKRGNPFIHKGFPHCLTIYLTANWLRFAVRSFAFQNRYKPLFIRDSDVSTQRKKWKVFDCEYTHFFTRQI